MAKILLATLPASGHVNPALTMAESLIKRGHDVVWCSGAKFKEKIEITGVKFIPFKVAKNLDEEHLNDEFPGRDKLKGLKQLKFDLRNFFVEQAIAQYTDIKNILNSFDADILLSDPAFAGSTLLTDKEGLPYIIFGVFPLLLSSKDTAPFGLGLTPMKGVVGRLRNKFLNWITIRFLFRDIQKYANSLRKKLGLAPMKKFFMEYGCLKAVYFLQGCTQKFEYKRSDLPSNVKFIGPFIPPPSNKPVPDRIKEKLNTDKKIIHVSQGTIDNKDFNKLIIPTLEAFKDSDHLIAVSACKGGAENLRKRFNAPNIIIEDFFDYHYLLPKVDVMITNGGYGGVLFALSKGVPLVVAGNTEDKKEVCARVGYFKVGINLKTDRPSAGQIKKAVSKIFTDDTYRKNAEAVKIDFAKHDAEKELAEMVEKFVKSR